MAEDNQRSRKVITGLSLLGIEKRYVPNKHYLYILSVKWSEGSEFIIYRRYSAFFQLHQKLSELFPIETGAVSKKDQTIPPLPKQRWFRNENFKVADERMLTIDEYCRKVAMAEPKISEHEEVLSFFETLPEDLTPPPSDPKKPNKTYLTFESKSGGNKVKEKSADKSGEDMEISAPILLETYRAIATFTPSGKTEVRLEEGAHVDVVEKNMSGWWLVQVDEKQGWCPASYLEPLDQPEERDEERPNWEGEEFLTTQQYEAQIDDEISFDEGVIVHVIHKLLDGWWIVRYNDKVGYAPCAYLQKYTNPHLPLHKARARIDSDTSTGSFIKKLPPRRSTIRKKTSAHQNVQKQRDLQMYRRNTLEASRRSKMASSKLEAAREDYRRLSQVTEGEESETADTDAEGYLLPNDSVKASGHPYVNESVIEEMSRKNFNTSSTTNDGKATESRHAYVNEEVLAQGTASPGNVYTYVSELEEAQTQAREGRSTSGSSADDVWAPAFVSSKNKAAETRNSNSSSTNVRGPDSEEGTYMDMVGDAVGNSAAEGYIYPDNTAGNPYVNESVVEEIAGRNKARNSNSSEKSVWAPAFVDEEKSKKNFPKDPNYIDSNKVASKAGKKTEETQYLNLGYVPDASVSSSAWNKGPNSDNTASTDSSLYGNIDVQQNIAKGTTTTRPERGPRSPRTPRAPVPTPRSTTPNLLIPGTSREKSNSGGSTPTSGHSTPRSGRSTPKSGRSSPKNGRLSPCVPARPTAAEIAAKCSSQTKLRILQSQQASEDSGSNRNGRLTPKGGHSMPKSGPTPPKSPKSNRSSPGVQSKGTVEEIAAKFGKVLQRK